ncbi:hypothetical protein JTE90_029631 [Oedothorax gibbosus]|uniref:Peptidase S1 domain-containing protein n=1 Tax=Oedothorax gibbosus TaxID=931172 RepID=A0AAV6VG54_9ARAC|nr:hypothetical protein JTE90_029631 [Oedothorax gibbosus]
MRAKLRNFVPKLILVAGLFVYIQASTNSENGPVIQEYLRWNYTYMNPECRDAGGGRNQCSDIRTCNFATASLALGGWPTLCGWVAEKIPKVCCGLPLVLECGRRTWGEAKSPTREKFFAIVESLPPVDLSNPDKFDPPLDLSVQTMVSPVGGRVSRQGDFPWMVSIRSNGSHVCGGTLIDRKHALSAAHCFVSYGKKDNPKYFTVHVGNIKVDQGFPFQVKDITIHEDYKPEFHYNDIAILTLDEEILSPWVAHICLPSPELAEKDLTGEKTSLLGWGDTSFGGYGTSELHIVDDIPVVSNKVCSAAYGKIRDGRLPQGVTPDFICAGNMKEGGKDACQSDSGGPLMYRGGSEWNSQWILVGVVSFGFRCGEPGFPGVYTRVSSFMPWIIEHIH